MNQIMDMNYTEFVDRLLKNTLPSVTCIPKGLVREHGGTFETLETTLQWMYMNRYNLAYREPQDMFFHSPFFYQSHDHWIDIELEKNWEETEIIKLNLLSEIEANRYNYFTFPEFGEKEISKTKSI
jgi:hypothetical protein